ncbi:MAG: glycosyltransferase family 4 protein [Verrucomicrobiae bacterium]|nr:glycosyltransferase family 4 protein [Verrucomicrobiae bacterium]
MNILLLNQTFYPDVVATAQVLSEAATALAARGHAVTVLTSRRAYDDPRRAFPRRETWRGVRIVRVGATGFGKRARWRRAVDFGSFMASCAARLAVMPRPDVVVALTSPPLISVLGALFARWRRARFVYWVMDLNPDEALAAGWLRDGSLAARWLEAVSRFSLKRADAIVALDRFMAERIAAKGVAPEKIAVLPPWSHDEAVRFDAAGREAFRREHGLGDKFVVMYSGNHSPCHPLDTLLAAAEAMAGEERFVFLFVGGGSEFGRVQRRARERGLANVRCLPYQPLERLSASLSAADLHVVVMGERFVGTIHPCKIYNVLRVRAPVLYIGPQPSHLSDVLARLGSEVCGRIAHGDVAGCVREIRRIAALRRRGEPERFEAVAEEFSGGRLLPRFIEWVEGGATARVPAAVCGA